MPEYDHFPLIFGQSVYHLHYSMVRLVFHDGFFCVGLFNIQHIKNIVVNAGFNDGVFFGFSKMIDTKIVGNTHGPLQKFVFFLVIARPQVFNYFNKKILKNIFCQVFIFYQQADRSKDLGFVPVNQQVQGLGFAVDK